MEGRWATDLESLSSQTGHPGRECPRLGQGNAGKGTALQESEVPYGEGLRGNLNQIQLDMTPQVLSCPGVEKEASMAPPSAAVDSMLGSGSAEQSREQRETLSWRRKCQALSVATRVASQEGREGGLYPGSAGYIEAPGLRP